MTSPSPVDTSSIPSWTTRTVLAAGAPTLVWALDGRATVSLATSRWTVGSGEALWIPGGERAVVSGDEGSCLVPIRIRDADRTSGPTDPFVSVVPAGSTTALLAAFTRSLGVLHGGGVRAAAILGHLGHPSAPIAAPILPPSPDLRRVAEWMLAAPTSTTADAAAAHGMSESTLARRFRAETGWTPQRWRARRTLADAAEQVRLRGSVAAGVAASGYSSPQAFARALRREWDVTPGMLVGEQLTPTPPDPRSAEFGPQSNGYHVVLWLAAGTARAEIDGTTTSLDAGDVVCLPAGSLVALQTADDAAVIPLGWLPGGIPVAPGLVARVGADARVHLLRLAAWAYAGVEPAAAGEPRVALQRLLGLTDPESMEPQVARTVYALLDRLAREPQDGRSTAELATQIGIPPAALGEAVETLTGTTLATWRARMRMSWARRLLQDGVQATQVAQRIGYSDAAALNHAFTRAHGSPPTQFRARHLRATPR